MKFHISNIPQASSILYPNKSSRIGVLNIWTINEHGTKPLLIGINTLLLSYAISSTNKKWVFFFFFFAFSSFPFSHEGSSPNKNGIPFISLFIWFTLLDSGTMHLSYIDVLRSRDANELGSTRNMVRSILKWFIKPSFKVGTVSDLKP